jgi:hypothetical protein
LVKKKVVENYVLCVNSHITQLNTLSQGL